MWSCFHRIRIRRINQYLDRQGEFQATGNRCCTSWRRSIFYEWEQESILFIGAVEESADITRLVDLGSAKGIGAVVFFIAFPHRRSSGIRWDIMMPVPDRNVQAILWYGLIRSSNGFVVALQPILP